eukprot:GHVU01145887.1.p1 GENE.GHVU01145887.1~~GHVU01145887.1.p1  ORF type:complete len:216 (-),score=0.59 GHVU01145887.1:287-934(-)
MTCATLARLRQYTGITQYAELPGAFKVLWKCTDDGGLSRVVFRVNGHLVRTHVQDVASQSESRRGIVRNGDARRVCSYTGSVTLRPSMMASRRRLPRSCASSLKTLKLLQHEGTPVCHIPGSFVVLPTGSRCLSRRRSLYTRASLRYHALPLCGRCRPSNAVNSSSPDGFPAISRGFERLTAINLMIKASGTSYFALTVVSRSRALGDEMRTTQL